MIIQMDFGQLRLLQICVYKESGELLFKKPLWVIVTGERRFELSLRDIFDCYRQRFDMEVGMH